MVNEIALACRALGDPQRLKIIRILASRKEDCLCVTDLAKILRISQPAVSQHMAILKRTGIVDFIKDGSRVHYGVNIEQVKIFKEKFDAFFLKGFTPCPYNMRCSECPEKENCA